MYEARYQDAPVAVKDSPSLNEIEMYMAVGVHDNVVGLRGLCQKVRAASQRRNAGVLCGHAACVSSLCKVYRHNTCSWWCPTAFGELLHQSPIPFGVS